MSMVTGVISSFTFKASGASNVDDWGAGGLVKVLKVGLSLFTSL